MFQKFYTDTLGGRFIKSLLAQTPLPVFDSVVDGDHLVAGCYYVYKRFIIQCVKGGILKLDSSESKNLFPSNTLYPCVFLYPEIGTERAEFYVKSYIDDYNIKTHSAFKSSTNYYDSETHYYLGKYLRYLHTTTGINLFPFYNCYNSTYFSDVVLHTEPHKEVSIHRVNSSNYKVVGVPIHFGKTYSVFIDCPTQVMMRACIHDNSGFVEEENLLANCSKESSDMLQSTLATSGKIYSNLRFTQPVKFSIDTTCSNALMLQHNLYLVIQLPSGNDSSIVVLEDYEDKTGIRCYKDTCVRKPGLTNLSLLKMNTRSSYAFSNRLIEYLLGNVIHPDDFISQNISKVQTALGNIFTDYKLSFISGKHKKGVWDSDIGSLIQSLIDDDQSHTIYDQDGNINKDTEILLYSRGGKY